MASGPSQGSFDDPAFWEDDEVMGLAALDDHLVQSLAQVCSGIWCFERASRRPSSLSPRRSTTIARIGARKVEMAPAAS